MRKQNGKNQNQQSLLCLNLFWQPTLAKYKNIHCWKLKYTSDISFYYFLRGPGQKRIRQRKNCKFCFFGVLFPTIKFYVVVSKSWIFSPAQSHALVHLESRHLFEKEKLRISFGTSKSSKKIIFRILEAYSYRGGGCGWQNGSIFWERGWG